MPDPNRRNMSVHTEVYEKIKQRYDNESSDKSFVRWVSEYLLVNLEKDKFLAEYAPYISKLGIQDNVLTLKDSKKSKYVEIRMKNGVLQSSEDDPIYLQYAMALPEIVALRK